MKYTGYMIIGCLLLSTACAHQTKDENNEPLDSMSTESFASLELDVSPGSGMPRVMEAQIIESLRKVKGTTGSVVLGYSGGDDHYTLGRYFFTGQEDRGVYLATYSAGEGWVVPEEFSHGYVLCSDLERFRGGDAPRFFCYKSIEDHDHEQRTQKQLRDELLSIISKREAIDPHDLILEIRLATKTHIHGAYYTREILRDFGEISITFFAIQKDGVWHIPDSLVGNGINLCDPTVDWKSFPEEMLLESFDETKCREQNDE